MKPYPLIWTFKLFNPLATNSLFPIFSAERVSFCQLYSTKHEAIYYDDGIYEQTPMIFKGLHYVVEKLNHAANVVELKAVDVEKLM